MNQMDCLFLLTDYVTLNPFYHRSTTCSPPTWQSKCIKFNPFFAGGVPVPCGPESDLLTTINPFVADELPAAEDRHSDCSNVLTLLFPKAYLLFANSLTHDI